MAVLGIFIGLSSVLSHRMRRDLPTLLPIVELKSISYLPLLVLGSSHIVSGYLASHERRLGPAQDASRWSIATTYPDRFTKTFCQVTRFLQFCILGGRWSPDRRLFLGAEVGNERC
jgi:hypothetical protein